jgi:hypothetical protein
MITANCKYQSFLHPDAEGFEFGLCLICYSASTPSVHNSTRLLEMRAGTRVPELLIIFYKFDLDRRLTAGILQVSDLKVTRCAKIDFCELLREFCWVLLNSSRSFEESCGCYW